MKIIYNDFIPFRGFSAINLFGVIFARNGKSLPPHIINRQKIRTAQMRELLYVGFYLIYIVEWLYNLVRYPKKAYRCISFEIEARKHQNDYDYLSKRKPFAQWRKA